METQEEYQAQIIKGKRTKRQRPPSPIGFQMVSSSSSTAFSGGDGVRMSADYDGATATSPTSSAGVTESSTVEEDHDMANCLILLAQGRRDKPPAESFYIYQCKTCDRCFPSFQALGGHRASHKKPKNTTNYIEENDPFNSATILTLQMPKENNIKPKVHECSICGSTFSSGQALGGHMRRHRALTTTAMSGATRSSELMMKKERNLLNLDLNLPAPENGDRMTVAVLSASPLVDCLY